MPIMNHVRSHDGTTIGYTSYGAGPALILVDGALCNPPFGPSSKLAPLLARHFTVTPTIDEARDRAATRVAIFTGAEMEDLPRSSIERAGRRILLGVSSGGALALQAAARGVRQSIGSSPDEPPYVDDKDQRGGASTRVNSSAARGGNRTRGRSTS